jgi:lipopolysaccharide transport system ATP-binding protein
MSGTAVSAEGLGKKYRIGVGQGPYGRLTEALWDGLTARLRGRPRSPSEADFWALRDVSFELRAGATLGVIGRNGAGKSTLLKILSRITEPTTGRARLSGRVASLLDVGTGFHQELTGRENVYLSGAILGMRRAEIARRFDEIVEFADIGRFLETPVKRYSSGMKVRLGFAVAAFLEAEVLIVDEVLAVGDADFQRKSLGKMAQIGEAGRTVIFVSHNIPAVARLCDRVILLEHGVVASDGPTHATIQKYRELDAPYRAERSWNTADAPGDEVARLRSVRVVPGIGGRKDEVEITEPIEIEVEYETEAPQGAKPSVSLHFFNEEGLCLFAVNDWNNHEWWRTARNPGVVRATCRIPGNFLAEGLVSVTAIVGTYTPPRTHAIEQDAVAFLVVDRSKGEGVRGIFPDEWPGVVRPMLEWQVIQPETNGPVSPDGASRRPKRGAPSRPPSR